MVGHYETYARSTRRLHPDCWAHLQPFFSVPPYSMTNDAVWVLVRSGLFAPRNGAMVVGNTLRVRPGLLDCPPGQLLYGSRWSWQEPHGVANWAHEVFHIHQWRRDRWALYGGIFSGMVNSWLHGSAYDHDRIIPEREAILFEQYVRSVLEAAARRNV